MVASKKSRYTVFVEQQMKPIWFAAIDVKNGTTLNV